MAELARSTVAADVDLLQIVQGAIPLLDLWHVCIDDRAISSNVLLIGEFGSPHKSLVAIVVLMPKDHCFGRVEELHAIVNQLFIPCNGLHRHRVRRCRVSEMISFVIDRTKPDCWHK